MGPANMVCTPAYAGCVKNGEPPRFEASRYNAEGVI